VHDKNLDMIMAHSISEKVAAFGGRCYYVGGFVRDKLMGKENKDVDIEVHGIKPDQLESILDSLGNRISIGESFGIYNLKGYDLDIAMPRKEELRGQGHKDFDIFVDPFIGTEGAAKRRDFTFNALMQDVLTGEIVDHFNGVADLEHGVLRHVNDSTFAEDPLRVLRAAQFAARFEFTIAEETISLCKKMDLSHLSHERIEGELNKALLKARRPSIFFEALRTMEQLDVWFPELKALIDVKQNPVHHGEGDVWTHTMMVIDQAAKLKNKASSPLWFMYSAVCHDFGKAVCSEEINGIIHAYKHETIGLPIVKNFIGRISREVKLTDYILNMTELHMAPLIVAVNNSSVKSTNKMFDRSVDPMGLIQLSLADDRGRISANPIPSSEEFLMDRLAIFNDYMSRPYVMGKDLIDAGLKPGKEFTEILAHAHKLRLAGVPKEDALKQSLGFARKLH